MRFRKLRIAWSVGWGLAVVLLVVLWVRSYSFLTTKQMLVTPEFRFYLHSVDGTVAIQRMYRSFSGREFMPMFRKSDMSWLTTNAGIKIKRIPGIGIESVSVSYWLLTLGTIAIGIGPWLPWRFSIRTLLITTTLIALVLGLIVWLSHQ
jgi:hypothetical protein